MLLLDLRVVSDNYKFFHNCNSDKMDYRQKQSTKNDDEDDEDLEALRLAALQSLRAKATIHYKKQSPSQLQKVMPELTQTSRPSHKGHLPRRGYFPNQLQQRQNGNLYYQSPRNPNLIAIVPVDEHSLLQQTNLTCSVDKIDKCVESHPTEISKFHRFKDNGSGSDDEDNKDRKDTINAMETDMKDDMKLDIPSATVESRTEIGEKLKKEEDDQEDINDDDDDILLMADLEEEDSLERLMDEMEREMNVDKPSDRKEKKCNKKGSKESIKKGEVGRNINQKSRTEDCNNRKDYYNPVPTVTILKTERRSMSPYTNRISQKRRSLSPRSRSRKKSPRRSPRRSPFRQSKKFQREIMRYRSPRKSPVRYSPRSRSLKLSPRSRSPRLSPRRSPNKSPMRRSPIKKSSPRGRSPRLSPHSRSPRPKTSLTKSPRLTRSHSPKFSPLRLSPQSKSPLRSRSSKLSPRRISPARRISPQSKSPGQSPRRGFSRLLSPKISPRRISPRSRSPRLSPRRSPWSSPRHSPRGSPKRRRSPRWSPKDLSRKHGLRSVTPDVTNSPLYVKESSPMLKGRISPQTNRIKMKQKEDNFEKTIVTEKETTDIINDPVLEARRKKFESTRPIDPINANKKIKLSKQENTNKKVESLESGDPQSGNVRKINKVTEDYVIQETDLCLDTHYEFDEFEDTMENTSPTVVTTSVNSCIDLESQKIEKERTSKKNKKRDKEIYQVGKLKNELPLSERIGKEKKCKKRKDVVSDGPSDDMDVIFEDITVDGESDLRTELSRRRAERLNRTVPIQSARLVQSAFKGVVNEVVKSNAKANQRHLIKADEKSNQKEVRRVTVLRRSIPELHDSEDESTLDSKVPVRFRLGLNKQVQETKVTRKASKRQGRKIYFGVCVTICVTASWVGATHCIKYLYFHTLDHSTDSSSSNSSVTGLLPQHIVPYNAPFFTTWFCTNWEILYFPIYFLCQAARIKCNTPLEIIAENLRGFRDKGFTGGCFLIKCSLFCGLWVVTNYMYIYSLRILLATDVMALFATNVSYVYLLSWVILHEQFVGVRIVAVILCNTGIALLAYMDGITGSPTLGGVVLATLSGAGSAVYKVLFKKVIGETTFGQMSLFFSLIGLCNAALLWPICLTLYFSGAESVHWARLPWTALLLASILHLVANMLGNFSIALTYDLFITLGLITAVPVSAALDVVLYGAHFMGMKLAGMIFIAVGFFLVMFPDNWPDYITRLLRWSKWCLYILSGT
ncbi:uncharacterized protein LOC143148848 isoform X3 [Ptiloglossa arizonensis]|uniref:uncharacterized protein LOC143148848 isoform X3 n=1 Tax=Ptiloglossa arizonensis TaxID=3350558 RepID=UPI003F9F87D4